MDFSTRGTSQTPATAPRNGADVPAGHRQQKSKYSSKWLNVATVILLFGVAVLLIAIAFLPHSTNNDESKYINNKVFQAVDVSVGGSNGDQIYFGNLKALNDSYLVLQNVYYIPTNSSSSSITLEPLVCQIDAPFNQMVINRASVNWWENLQSSGKVAQAITNYEKSSKTPSCPQTSSTSSTGSTSSTTTPAATTPTTSTTKSSTTP